MERIDGHDRYIAEPVKPKVRVCECGRWTPHEADERDASAQGRAVKTPQDTARERIRELRQRHNWSQQDLADVLNDRFGVPVDRATVARVELGDRGLSLDEAFQYALALNVAPVNLFVPVDGDETVKLANVERSPAEMRAWVRGEQHLPPQDARTYFSQVPEEEFRARLEAHQRDVVEPYLRAQREHRENILPHQREEETPGETEMRLMEERALEEGDES